MFGTCFYNSSNEFLVAIFKRNLPKIETDLVSQQALVLNRNDHFSSFLRLFEYLLFHRFDTLLIYLIDWSLGDFSARSNFWFYFLC